MHRRAVRPPPQRAPHAPCRPPQPRSIRLLLRLPPRAQPPRSQRRSPRNRRTLPHSRSDQMDHRSP
ncbi:MAG: hypothetical protein EPN33_13475 [Acidobacteria bacterium]|nr:MAG: hypothetical protein EPN33_13475 [Acidobacteriota bacterium]